MKFDIVAKAKLRRKKQAEQDEKNSKKQRVPWRWDTQSTSMKAITATPVSEMTFKDYLINEAQLKDDRYAHLRHPELTDDQRGLIDCILTDDKADVSRSSYGGGVMNHFYCGQYSFRWDAGYTQALHKKWKAYKNDEITKDEFQRYTGAHLRKHLLIPETPWTGADQRHAQFAEREHVSRIPPLQPGSLERITLREARYYKQKEDWQEDINDYGQGVAVCPRCQGEAEMRTEGNSLATARSFWECRECGHTGPENKY